GGGPYVIAVRPYDTSSLPSGPRRRWQWSSSSPIGWPLSSTSQARCGTIVPSAYVSWESFGGPNCHRSASSPTSAEDLRKVLRRLPAPEEAVQGDPQAALEHGDLHEGGRVRPELEPVAVPHEEQPRALDLLDLRHGRPPRGPGRTRAAGPPRGTARRTGSGRPGGSQARGAWPTAGRSSRDGRRARSRRRGGTPPA